MTSLLLSILFASVLFVVFRLFNRFGIDTWQALIFNYLTAAALGFWLNTETLIVSELFTKSWFVSSLALGVLFISIFFAIARTSQTLGISVASVATKMSVIIPISAGFFLYQEKANFLLIIGIVLALFAVYLTSKKDTNNWDRKNLILPLIAFLGAGTIDASLQYVQIHYVKPEEVILFSANTFAVAFFAGILFVLMHQKGKITKLTGKNILGGIVLGLPNFGSLYFIILMLKEAYFESAVLFTIHNIAIVLFSTLISMLFFKEKMSQQNLMGILLSVVALILITLNS